MTKTLNKMSIEEVYIKQTNKQQQQQKRAIHDKPTTNIIVNSEKPKAFLVRSET